MTLREALAAAASRLTDSDTPRLDAELLAAHALGVSREAMLLDGLDRPFDTAAFDALVARRAAHEPLAYILGTREFWSLDLAVGPGALIPRPDSETLIEAAVAHFAGTPGPRTVLDLGTGSGALLLAALSQWPEATGLGVDRSDTALDWARGNAKRTGLAACSEWREGDWDAAQGSRFDLVLCNPPYVETAADLAPDVAAFEPHIALFAGADGLDAYRRIAPLLPGLLLPGGIACLEIGAHQADAVRALFPAEDVKIQCRQDLAGRDRCLVIHN